MYLWMSPNTVPKYAFILATAMEFDAILWTQDSDFKNIQGVKYFPKK